MEAVISALGEDDLAVPFLKEALRKARLQAQFRPVEDRIDGTKFFIERSKKRVGVLREQLSRVHAVVLGVEAKLVSEESALRDGERRLEALEQEAHAIPDTLPTVPADFAQKLSGLRACVQELRREGGDLRSELSKNGENRGR